MAFNSLMIRLAAEILEQLPPAPTVVEFGDRAFSPRGRDLSKVRDRLTRAGRAFDAAELDRLRRLRGVEREWATADYYFALGYAAYVAMDVEALASAKPFTHNFDLVTNSGSELILDQRVLFANIHRLCRRGGLMVHLLPFVGCVNHGFFSVHPLLFTALADANRYEILRLAIVNAEGTEFMVGPDWIGERATVRPFGPLVWFGRRRPRSHDRHLATAVRRALRAGSDLSVLAVLRKTSEGPFAVPFQSEVWATLDAHAIAVGTAQPAAAREMVGGLTGAAAEG